MISNLIYLIVNLLRISVIYQFYETVYSDSKANKKVKIFLFFLYYILNVTCYFEYNSPLVNVISNVIPLIILAVFEQEKINIKTAFPIFFFAFSMFTDGIVYALFKLSGHDSVFIGTGAASVLLTFLIEKILEKIMKKNMFEKTYVPKSDFILYFLHIGSIAIGALCLDDNIKIESCVVIFILFIFNFAVFYMYDKLYKSYRDIYEKKIISQKLESYRSEINIIKESQKRISILNHDLKNHLIAIEEYAKNNQNEEIIEYIKKLYNISQYDKEYVRTGNIGIDSILNYKLNEMKNNGIDIKYSITVPENIGIDEDDLNVILGNLMNNAIEALEKTENKKFFIDISFKDGVLYVHSENYFNGKLKRVNNEIETIKMDKENHGYGISSMKNIIKRYGGEIFFNSDKNIFSTDIILYSENRTET